MKVYLIIIAALLTASCNKVNGPLDGNYTGTFVRDAGSGGTPVQIKIRLKGNRFEGEAATPKYPAICKGSFELKDDEITFNNECVFTADFDWTLILSETWKLERISADHFIMHRSYGNAMTDTYHLYKQ